MLDLMITTTNSVLFLIYTPAIPMHGIRILPTRAHLPLDSIDRSLPGTKHLPANVTKENVNGACLTHQMSRDKIALSTMNG